MKVRFVDGGLQWACDELAQGLENVRITTAWVANEFRDHEDRRMLIVVRGCPCCDQSGEILRRLLQDRPDAVVVTPYRGIDPAGMKIREINVKSPFRTPGEGDEARDIEHFRDEWRKTIVESLK